MNNENILGIKNDFSLLVRTTQFELTRMKRYNRLLLAGIIISLFLNFIVLIKLFPPSPEFIKSQFQLMQPRKKN